MAVESGWAYVVGTEASGPKGSIQIAGQDTNLDHDAKLIWSETDEALVVSGNIIAKNFEIQSQTTTVVHLDVTGSSKFGDSEDDEHEFTGSISLTGDLDGAGNITATNFYGNGSNLIGVAVNTYDTQEVNHIVLGSGSAGIKTEANLSYENDTLYVTGTIQTNEVSSSLAYFDSVDAEDIDTQALTASNATTTFLTSSNMMFGDIVLTGRIIDANGKVLMSTSTADTSNNISTTSTGLTSISSATFSSLSNTATTGLEYVIVEEGLEVNGSSLIVRPWGDVGVGTNAPVRQLEVYDTDASQLRLSSVAPVATGGGIPMPVTRQHTDLGTNASGNFHILPTNGRVGVNTETPNYSLDVQGDVGISGDLYVTGTLHARTTDFIVSADTMILGDAATDEVVIKASTMTTPNGLTIDNDLFIDDGLIGIGAISSGPKLEVTSPSNQFRVGTSTKNLSISVNNTSTTLSTNNNALDISADTNILGELVVGPNGDIVLDNAGQLSASVSVSSHSGYFTNLTSSNITNGNTLISSNSIDTPLVNATTVNATSISATSIQGTILTEDQPNITSVGTLTSLDVANAANIGGPVGIGTTSPSRKVEIKDSDPQLRLTNTEEVFGLTPHTFADMHVTDVGDLSLLPSSGKVIVPSLNITNVPQGQSNVALAIDSNGNIITTTFPQSGIEVRNRIVTTTSYNMRTDDYFIALKADEDLVITLPDASVLQNGQIFVLTDEIGSAEDYSLVIRARANQTIDGQNQIVLVSPRSSISMYTDGSSDFFIF